MVRQWCGGDMARIKKTLVENCAVLDINVQIRAGLFDDGCGAHVFDSSSLLEGVLRVFTPVVDVEDRKLWIFLTTWNTGELKIFEPAGVDIEFSTAGFGGRKIWLKCPAKNEGHQCGTRVRKLFLPPGSEFFGCRKCHGLAYRASQEAKYSDDANSDEELHGKLVTAAGMIGKADADPGIIAALIGGLDTQANRKKRRRQFRELQVVVRRRANELAVYQGYAVGTLRHALIVESWMRRLELHSPERFYD
jgi:hypothetical protein